MKLLSTNSKAIKVAVFQHLLDAFNAEDYELNPTSVLDKIRMIKTTELKSMGWMLEHGYTSYKMHKDWLQGLGLNVEYMNHKILIFVAEINGVDVNKMPEILQDKIINNWFHMLTVKLEQLYNLTEKSKILNELKL